MVNIFCHSDFDMKQTVVVLASKKKKVFRGEEQILTIYFMEKAFHPSTSDNIL